MVILRYTSNAPNTMFYFAMDGDDTRTVVSVLQQNGLADRLGLTAISHRGSSKPEDAVQCYFIDTGQGGRKNVAQLP